MQEKNSCPSCPGCRYTTPPLSLRAAELVEIARVPRLIQQDMMYLVDNHNEQTQIVVREPFDGRRLLPAGGRESRQESAMVLVQPRNDRVLVVDGVA